MHVTTILTTPTGDYQAVCLNCGPLSVHTFKMGAQRAARKHLADQKWLASLQDCPSGCSCRGKSSEHLTWGQVA